MNDFGYLLITSSHKTSDYQKMAYLLALNIKRTQKPGYNQVAVVVDNKNDVDLFRISPAFDEVIFSQEYTHWDGRSYMDKLTPFKRTVCMDVDMLFTTDTSHWIDHFIKDSYGLYVASKIVNYKGELITDDRYRVGYSQNGIKPLYSAYTYFDLTGNYTTDFFELARDIYLNPDKFKNVFMPILTPLVIGTDEAFSMAAMILGIENDISYDCIDFPKITHLKSLIQGYGVKNINKELGYFIDGDRLSIGAFEQLDLVHYSEKNLDISVLMNFYEQQMKESFNVHNKIQ